MSIDDIKKPDNCNHMVLKLGERRYTCDICTIQEIVANPVIEPCLDGNEFQIGCFESTTGDIPVLDILCRTPDMCPIREMSLVIFEVSGRRISILADDLLELIEIESSWICPLPPGGNGVPDDLIRGVIEFNNCQYFMLDLERIVTTWQGVSSGKRTSSGETS